MCAPFGVALTPRLFLSSHHNIPNAPALSAPSLAPTPHQAQHHTATMSEAGEPSAPEAPPNPRLGNFIQGLSGLDPKTKKKGESVLDLINLKVQ